MSIEVFILVSHVQYTPNRYMYKNAMSMEDTVFSMNVADDGSFSGSASANFESTRPGERFG